MPEEKVGVVTHYFGHIQVAAVRVTNGPLKVGDKIHFKGHTTDFAQAIDSMQIDNVNVQAADVGAEIGMKVAQHARTHDEVFRVTE